MPLAISCDCGRSLRLKEELAGRRVRCPACQGVLTVPRLPSAEDEALAILLADSPEEKPRPTSPVRREAPPEPTPAPRPQPWAAPSRDLDVRKKEKKGRERDGSPGVAFEEGWFGSFNAGVVGGLLMVLIAVVWFVLGLAGGIIFFYPPILFVIGLVAIARGLFSQK